jgi:hypothetical protein
MFLIHLHSISTTRLLSAGPLVNRTRSSLETSSTTSHFGFIYTPNIRQVNYANFSFHFLDACISCLLAIQLTGLALSSLGAQSSGTAIFAAPVNTSIIWDTRKQFFLKMTEMRRICRTAASSVTHRRVYICMIERRIHSYCEVREMFKDYAIPSLRLYLRPEMTGRPPKPPSDWGSMYDPFQPVSGAQKSRVTSCSTNVHG